MKTQTLEWHNMDENDVPEIYKMVLAKMPGLPWEAFHLEGDYKQKVVYLCKREDKKQGRSQFIFREYGYSGYFEIDEVSEWAYL